VAYVYDEDGQFAQRCNTAMVSLDKVLTASEQEASQDRSTWHRTQGAEARADEVLLKKLIEDHHRWTGSLRARDIIDHWAEARLKFVKVFPNEYRRALGELHAAKQAEQAIAQTKANVAAASARA
jgi:glutamate synthase domain-containing protein 3